MSIASRREYLNTMSERYQGTKSRSEKTALIDEVVQTLHYHRKHATRVLRHPPGLRRNPVSRQRQLMYLESGPAIQLVWEALDFCCAERLHPVLLSTAEHLARHGSLVLSDVVRDQLSQISRSTLARRLARMPSPKCRSLVSKRYPGATLRSQVPLGRYDWDEDRPGALEIDLVEHNGGSSLGHFAYTLTVVDVVTGWSRRRAVLGRGQTGVHKELSLIISEWPCQPWGLHADNGSEFLNHQIIRFCRTHKLAFTRSRPYCKNDNAHAEQKNLQFVRNFVGYDRYDTPAQLDWLNLVYSMLDPYANMFLPGRKLISKIRCGPKVKKRYDTAATPFQRLCSSASLDQETHLKLQQYITSTNPLLHYRALRRIIEGGFESMPTGPITPLEDAAD